MSGLKKRIVEYYSFYCQGCKHEHTYSIFADGSQWSFNGNMDKPSFTPSLLNTVTIDDKQLRCHLFIIDGKIIYCGDCTHELAGQTIDL